MRQGLGTAVFAGMLGVTLFGLHLTPVLLRGSEECGPGCVQETAGEAI